MSEQTEQQTERVVHQVGESLNDDPAYEALIERAVDALRSYGEASPRESARVVGGVFWRALASEPSGEVGDPLLDHLSGLLKTYAFKYRRDGLHPEYDAEAKLTLETLEEIVRRLAARAEGEAGDARRFAERARLKGYTLNAYRRLHDRRIERLREAGQWPPHVALRNAGSDSESGEGEREQDDAQGIHTAIVGARISPEDARVLRRALTFATDTSLATDRPLEDYADVKCGACGWIGPVLREDVEGGPCPSCGAHMLVPTADRPPEGGERCIVCGEPVDLSETVAYYRGVGVAHNGCPTPTDPTDDVGEDYKGFVTRVADQCLRVAAAEDARDRFARIAKLGAMFRRWHEEIGVDADPTDDDDDVTPVEQAEREWAESLPHDPTPQERYAYRRGADAGYRRGRDGAFVERLEMRVVELSELLEREEREASYYRRKWEGEITAHARTVELLADLHERLERVDLKRIEEKALREGLERSLGEMLDEAGIDVLDIPQVVQERNDLRRQLREARELVETLRPYVNPASMVRRLDRWLAAQDTETAGAPADGPSVDDFDGESPVR